MARWIVKLVTCYDGSKPDEKYVKGVEVQDRRSSPHDLIVMANIVWRTNKHPGEVYSITPLDVPAQYRVNEDGGVERL